MLCAGGAARANQLRGDEQAIRKCAELGGLRADGLEAGANERQFGGRRPARTVNDGEKFIEGIAAGERSVTGLECLYFSFQLS